MIKAILIERTTTDVRFGGDSRKSRAAVGGQIGVNGFEYKGGQFLPSTELPPGSFRDAEGKVRKGSKGELIAPGKFETPPSPTSRSVFSLMGPGYMTVFSDEGIPTINQGSDGTGVRDHQGQAITLQTVIAPGVRGVIFDSRYTLQELIDQYSRGARWIELSRSNHEPVANTNSNAKVGLAAE